MDIYERLNQIDHCLIKHAAIQRAISGIDAAIKFSEGSKEPVNILLTGEAGTGKTTTCNAILAKRKRTIEKSEDAERVLVPAFYSLVPSPVTIKGVASSMLYALGDPAPSKGNALDLTFRLGKLLRQCKTEVILLDELQHLLKHDMGKSDNVKDWLKTVINEFRVPVVVVGMPECAEIISQDAQLARRFQRHYKLGDLAFGGRKKGPFRKFVESLSGAYIQIVKLDSVHSFAAREYALMMYAATGGNPANTSTLFKQAALEALLEGRESVTLEDFSKAYSGLQLPNALKFEDNPFEMSERTIAEALQSCYREAA